MSSYLKFNINIITNSVLVGECFIRVSDCSIRVFRSISANNGSWGKKMSCMGKGMGGRGGHVPPVHPPDKISFRMYLNLCNAKFSRIDVEKRVYKKVILSLHFSMASFNMHGFFQTPQNFHYMEISREICTAWIFKYLQNFHYCTSLA